MVIVGFAIVLTLDYYIPLLLSECGVQGDQAMRQGHLAGY